MGATWDETRWETLAAAVFLGMKEWRLQHPKATFAEIEGALDTRLSGLRARMLQDVALASAAVSVRGARPEDRTECPACGGRLAARGVAARRLTVGHDRTVTLPRAYAVCPACGTGLFPPG